MTRQHRPNNNDDSAHQFSAALPFPYAHLTGICRKKVLLELFGENNCDIVCPQQCCDVCDQEIGLLGDKKLELTLLLQAIDELKNVGEITEWIRGGNVAWMQNVTKLSPSAYGQVQ